MGYTAWLMLSSDPGKMPLSTPAKLLLRCSFVYLFAWWCWDCVSAQECNQPGSERLAINDTTQTPSAQWGILCMAQQRTNDTLKKKSWFLRCNYWSTSLKFRQKGIQSHWSKSEVMDLINESKIWKNGHKNHVRIWGPCLLKSGPQWFE